MTLYDWGVDTPLIIRYPGRLPAGAVVDELASTPDVFPTLLELIDAPVPPELQGINLVSIMKKREGARRKEVFCETNYHVFYNPMRCIITDRWKYIRSFRPEMALHTPEDYPQALKDFSARDIVGQKNLKVPFPVTPRPKEELFDLEQDPLETRNLAERPEYHETLAALRQRLDRWMTDTNDNPMEEMKYLGARGK